MALMPQTHRQIAGEMAQPALITKRLGKRLCLAQVVEDPPHFVEGMQCIPQVEAEIVAAHDLFEFRPQRVGVLACLDLQVETLEALLERLDHPEGGTHETGGKDGQRVQTNA